MKKFISLLFAAFLFLSLFTTKANAIGLFYNDTTYPVTATGAHGAEDINNLKQGKSSAWNILVLVEMGDSGINKAAKDGNIKKIYYVDYNLTSYFIFFARKTTTVYGE